jgi:DNA polymerase-3 subunit alpha
VLFLHLPDFIVRCPNKAINKKSLEALAKAGALSGLAEPNEVIENIKVITDFAKSAEKSEADESQNSLFGDEMDSENHELILPEKEPASDAQRLAWERETLGLFVSDHPLKKAKELFSNGGTLVSKLKLKKGKKVRVGGIVLGFRKIITKTKKTNGNLTTRRPHRKSGDCGVPQNIRRTIRSPPASRRTRIGPCGLMGSRKGG